MHFSTILATSAIWSLAGARIIGLAAPSVIAPGSDFDLKLLTEGYIQTVADVAAAWGYAASPGHAQSLGSYTGSSYIGPSQSNTYSNVTIATTAPSELASLGDEITLSAAVYSLYGASGSPSLAEFNVTVQVGNQTSTSYVASSGFA